jgi:hypothetical protein
MANTKKKRTFIQYLPIYGCIATGLIYVAIGVIAMLSFLKIRHGGADESSMLMVLNDFLLGKILVGIILLGTISYIIWRIYETITDPYGYGKDTKGLAKRSGIALSAIADALIVIAATRVLLGVSDIQLDGQPKEEREMVRHLLAYNSGAWLVIAIGFIILATAIVQLLYGITKGYSERVDMDHFNPVSKTVVNLLALIGYFARGIILGITGFFFIKAGIIEDPFLVVNTDQAFDFIGDNVGHIYFIMVAIGTISYGLFMFALGMTYDVDKD